MLQPWYKAVFFATHKYFKRTSFDAQHNETNCSIRKHQLLNLVMKTPAFETLYGDQFTLSMYVDKTKLSCYTPHLRSTKVSLET